MEIEKERNRNSLDRITFHLDQAMRFCNQLGPVEEENKSWLCIQFSEWAVLLEISYYTNAEHSYSL